MADGGAPVTPISKAGVAFPAGTEADPINVTGGGSSDGLTDAELRATPVPVSGTIATGGLTDAELRAIPVPVSGTVATTGSLTDTQLRATPVPVSGDVTATVDTSALATSTKQDTQITAEQAILAKLTADPATQTTLAAVLAKIIAAPATEATLAAQSAKLPAALGQSTAANSLSVVPASDYININQPHALTANRWQYAAAASGIVNASTAVMFKAADASLRNYIASFQYMHEALTTATELVIRDGAGGTVLWRSKIPAGVAGYREVVLPCPIKGTAATLLEVVTLTASGAGAVYFNAQGFVAA